MQQILASLFERPVITLAIGAFFSGVALFYLVMQRTRQHRIRQAEKRGL